MSVVIVTLKSNMLPWTLSMGLRSDKYIASGSAAVSSNQGGLGGQLNSTSRQVKGGLKETARTMAGSDSHKPLATRGAQCRSWSLQTAPFFIGSACSQQHLNVDEFRDHAA